MSSEYVDNTPIGDGGSQPVVLDMPIQETQATDEAAAGASGITDPALAQTEQAVDAQASEAEKPLAEAAAAEKEEAQADIEAKTPEEKASHWRGEFFKAKQASETRIAELEGQLAEASATPAFVKLDKPPSEWNPADQLKDMPAAYADKLRSHGFWETLPNVIENLDTQPMGVQNAIYETMNKVFQKQTGASFEQMVKAFEGASTAAPTQTNQPQSNEIQRLEATIQGLVAEGYTDSDPALANAKLALSSERRAAASEGQVRQLTANYNGLLQRLDKTDKSQQAYTQQQAEQAFESKKTGVWTNALKTFEGKVPQGKEFLLDFIRDRAESLVNADSTAKGYIDKVRGFMLAATTPEEREQYERLANGSMVAYNAKVALAVQAAAKHLLGEAAEKEQLRTAVHQQQMTRRDIDPGQSGAPSGSREDILKGRIDGNADVAAEMAAAIYRSRKAS